MYTVTVLYLFIVLPQSTVKQFELLCCLYSVDTVDPFGAATQLQLVCCVLLLFIVVCRELMEKDVLRRKDKKDVETDVHSKVIIIIIN